MAVWVAVYRKLHGAQHTNASALEDVPICDETLGEAQFSREAGQCEQRKQFPQAA